MAGLQSLLDDLDKRFRSVTQPMATQARVVGNVIGGIGRDFNNGAFVKGNVPSREQQLSRLSAPQIQRSQPVAQQSRVLNNFVGGIGRDIQSGVRNLPQTVNMLRSNPSDFSKGLDLALNNQTNAKYGNAGRYAAKTFEGIAEGTSASLYDLPVSKSQNPLETAAYSAGYGLGLVNPVNPVNAIAGKIAPAFSGIQKPLEQVAGNLISRGGLTNLVGKGVMNFSQGLPFTASYALTRKLGGQNYGGGDLATDSAVDLALGATPIVGGLLIGSKGAMNQGKKELGQMTGDFANTLDKKLRREISDAVARVKPSVFDALKSGKQTVMALGDLLPHPKLYEAYPDFKLLKVEVDPTYELKGTSGSFDPKTFTIKINPYMKNVGEMKATLLHEIQHAVQQVEGFAKGGSPNAFKTLGDPEAGYRRLAGELESRATANRGELQNFERIGNDPYRATMQQEGLKPDQLITRLDETESLSKQYVDRTKLTGLQLETPNAKLMKAWGKTKPQRSSATDDILVKAKRKIGDTESSKPLKQYWNEFYSNFVNRFQPVENIVNEAEKKGKFKMRPEYNPTYAIKRFLGSGGTAELRHKRELQPIIDQLGNVDKSDFDLFLKAKRDIELGNRGVYGSSADEGRGIINALTEKYGNNVQKFEDTANKLYTYQDSNLQRIRDSGFITDETYQKIKDANKNYVPFQRVMDEIDNFLGVPAKSAQQSAQPIKKLEGSLRNVYSPLESIIMNTYKTEAAIAKNRVTTSLVGLRKLGKEYAEMFTPVKNSGADTISVWENGQKVYYRVPDDVARAIKGLDEESSNIVIEILSAPARLLRQQATGRNLEFMLPNVIRDQFDAALNSKYGYIPFVSYFSGLKEMIKARNGGSEIYDQWMKSGGKIFFENMGGRKAIRQQVEDATKKRNILKKISDWTLGGIDAIGKISEEPTRIGLFKKAYQKTGNPLIGAMESREGTLDFARMGSKMKVANSIIPFLNVGVQGFDRMVRTIKDDPKRATMLLATYGGLPAIATSLYNNLYHKDAYAQVPDFIKQDNFVIMTGGQDEDGNPSYMSIPKGHIVSLIANPTEAVVNYGFQTNPQSMSQFALSFLSGQLPLAGQDDNVAGILSKTVGNLTPQIIKPAAESMANYSFFKGKPIVPSYLQNKPVELQTSKYTPEVYNKLGMLLGVSPLKAQNFIEGYLAGGVKQPLNISKTLGALSRGEMPKPNDTFVLRRLYGSYSGFDTERPSEAVSEPSFMDRIGEVFRPAGVDASTSSRPKSEYMNTVDEERAKNKVRQSGEVQQTGDKIFYKDGDEVKSVPLNRPLKTPKLTGNKLLDKEQWSDYKGSITSKKNDIVTLWQQGVITAEQASNALVQLNALSKQASRASGSKKAPKSKSSDLAKIAGQTFNSSKLSKPQRIKLSTGDVLKSFKAKRQAKKPDLSVKKY